MKTLLVVAGLLFSLTLLVVMQGLTTAHAQSHGPVLFKAGE